MDSTALADGTIKFDLIWTGAAVQYIQSVMHKFIMVKIWGSKKNAN